MKKLFIGTLLLLGLVLAGCPVGKYTPCVSNIDCQDLHKDTSETICFPYYRIEDCSLYGKFCANPAHPSNDGVRWIKGQAIVKYKFMCIDRGK